MTHQILNLLRQFYLPLSLVLLTLVIQLFSLDDLLEFDRSEIASGSWWLLITGHLCHLDWQHLIFNDIALLIIWELFYRRYSTLKASIQFVSLCLCVGLGIYFFNPNIEWYVGLSGVLHGLFIIGIAKEVTSKNILSILVLIGFIGKIVWEQTVGITTGFLFEEDSVLVDAHLYGAIGGACFALAYFVYRNTVRSK